MMISTAQHSISYFKRFRMEMELQDELPPVPSLPEGYTWVPWSDDLLEQHADVKYQCFLEEIDATVFASLSSKEGCQRLMQEIAGKIGFRPEATWMIAAYGESCATIQGIRERSGMGAIQNVGVTAPHRGLGLGTALVLKALHGFKDCGAHRAHLEVTAQNTAAIRLYRRLGFRCRKTLYKAVDLMAPLSNMGAAETWFD